MIQKRHYFEHFFQSKIVVKREESEPEAQRLTKKSLGASWNEQEFQIAVEKELKEKEMDEDFNTSNEPTYDFGDTDVQPSVKKWQLFIHFQ